MIDRELRCPIGQLQQPIEGNPEFATVLEVLQALGLRLRATAT
jgi:DNA-binding phage protein